jgi:hypothetical protein
MLHLPFLPHQQRLIYVNPARTDYVIPFNVLATQAEHPSPRTQL